MNPKNMEEPWTLTKVGPETRIKQQAVDNNNKFLKRQAINDQYVQK